MSEIVVTILENKEKKSKDISSGDSVNNYEDDSGSSRSSTPTDGENEELKREEGDGEEVSAVGGKVDDDEDKKNPQYIPKKGVFYEHDDRTAEQEEVEEAPEKTDKVNKKTVWIDKKDHWGHDKYNDSEQAPKSKSELVAIYGYDIRNEDGPPKARRRRRYGRGPSKYTRNWEDEDAYRATKQEKPIKKREKKLGDFVTFNKNENEQVKVKNNIQVKSDTSEKNTSLDNENKEKKVPESIEVHKKVDKQFYKPQNNKIPMQRKVEPESSNAYHSKRVDDSDYKGFTKSRQYRSGKYEQKVLPKGVDSKSSVVKSQSFSSKKSSMAPEEVEKSTIMFSKMNFNDSNIVKNNKHIKQTQIPPRLQTEQKGSKRYSSLRQRSLPETSSSPGPQANFYPPEYTHQRSQQPSTVVLSHSSASIHASAVAMDHVPPAPLQTIPQQITVPNAPLLPTQPHYVTPFPPGPPPFIQPPVTQQPFIPQQPSPAGLINFVPTGQAQFTHPPTAPFEAFQAPQFNSVTPQRDLCQYQGGTTYYSTQNQHIPQRLHAHRRPKAAIPIVPPPQESAEEFLKHDEDYDEDEYFEKSPNSEIKTS